MAVQEAEKQKLDRTPQAVLATEEAKRGLLVRAYAEKVAPGQAPVTDAGRPSTITTTRIYLFSANAGVKPAEQLPVAHLPKLTAMLNGQSLVVNLPRAMMAVELVNSQLRPRKRT